MSGPRTGDFTRVDVSDHTGERSRYLERAAATLAAVKRESLAALRLQPGERVPDVGCGTGESRARSKSSRTTPGRSRRRHAAITPTIQDKGNA